MAVRVFQEGGLSIMSKIRVLVVDDSRLARELIAAILSNDEEIEIVGEAANGQEAIHQVVGLKPHIVTMDIVMPVMDGLAAIEQIMAHHAVPILVVTSKGDAHTAFAAISKGALDLVEKPSVNLENAREFIHKIKLLARVHVITHIRGKLPRREAVEVPQPASKAKTAERAVAIASSTGGPEALSILLSALPENCPFPIVVAQHISDGFVAGLVEWLKRICKLQIRIGVEGEKIVPGTVYFSASERHMKINRHQAIAWVDRQPSDIYRPSCDLLLSSVAEVYGEKSIGIILTGMGHDGVLGIKKIREIGGRTIAQDEKTSVVFGMPRVAIENGFIDQILPVQEISGEVLRLTNRFPKA